MKPGLAGGWASKIPAFFGSNPVFKQLRGGILKKTGHIGKTEKMGIDPGRRFSYDVRVAIKAFTLLRQISR